MSIMSLDPRPTSPPEPPPDNTADLKYAVTELNNSQPGYARAADYYFGTQPEYFASLRMKIAMGASGVMFNYNFAKLAVDAVSERMEISGVSIQDDDAHAFVTEEWEANQLDLFAPDIMLQASKFGDAYVFIWPSPDEQLEDGSEKVDIFYCSPRVMRLFYDDEDEHHKKYAIKRWIDQTTDYMFVNLYYEDRIEKYMMAPETMQGTKPLWQKRIDPEDDGQWPLDNPFGEVPVFHFRNAFPYGRPEHRDAYGPQDSIQKLVISHMASVDYNAFPQRYAIMEPGFDTSEAAFGDEGEYAFTLNTGGTMHQEIDPGSQLTADPASVWFMRGIKQYGEFTPADPIAFLRPFTEYVHAMAVVTTTPMHFLDPIVSNVSGESLRVIEAPFAKKVRKRQLSFGATWRDVWRFSLKVHGMSEHIPVQVNWVPAATVSDLSSLQGQQIKYQLGVPARQLLLELGYTPEQLDAWGVTIPPDPPTVHTQSGPAVTGLFAQNLPPEMMPHAEP